MRNISLVSLVIVISLISCKKNNKTNCLVSVTAVSGYYKLTKVQIGGSDVTSTFLTQCQLGAVMELYVDKTAVYEEQGGNPCSGSGGGTWDLDVNTNKISINSSGNFPSHINDGTITGWDCTTLVVSGTYMSQNYIITLTKTKNI